MSGSSLRELLDDETTSTESASFKKSVAMIEPVIVLPKRDVAVKVEGHVHVPDNLIEHMITDVVIIISKSI